jgi:hypothetical protein
MPAIPINGDLQVGYVNVPFLVMQDADNSLVIFIGNSVESVRFSTVEIIVDDEGNVRLKVGCRGDWDINEVIGNVINPDSKVGQVTESTTVLRG